MFWLACLLAPASAAADPRADFLHAEQALAQGRIEQALSVMARIEDYVLTPYLELAWAEQQLGELPHERIAQILERHHDLPIAWRLRRAWVDRLATERQWPLLLRHHVDEEHPSSACHVAHALAQLGRTHEAWNKVAALWQTAQSLPDICDPALDAWRAAGQLTPDLAWARAALALGAGNTALARYLTRYLEAEDASLFERWIALRSAPDGLAELAREGGLEQPRKRALILDVFARAARRDTANAQRLWTALANQPIDATLLATMREQVGEVLARNGDPQALQWLDAAGSASALDWRAIAALRTGQWRIVADSVDAMPADEAASERWRYWQGRAWRALGDVRGEDALRALARERSYYGFLAADHAGTPYMLRDLPTDTDAATLEAVQQDPAARRAREWLALGRSVEARREWDRLVARSGTAEQRAAAVLAHRWDWHDAAIRSAAAARSWDDLALRFPLAHPEPVRVAANQSALPASRIYAVIRQESAFMHDVRSSAGALGLMQLMPATAREVARRANIPHAGTRDLINPTHNLRLGSLYMARLEQQYRGHTVLATAAYNAGPGRVRGWLPASNAMDSDLWIELVPFNETRGYLRAVLAYQIIYARRLGEDALRLRDLMPPVPPTRS